MADLISTEHLRRLQTMFSQFQRRSFDAGGSRAERLSWSTQVLGRESRPVESWSKLTKSEALTLDNALRQALQLRETSPSARQRKSTRDRQKMGTEGRRDQVTDEVTMLDGTEHVFRLIQQELTALGWDQGRLQAFLRSRSGPNYGRTTIRTLKEANRVHWALKRLAQNAAEQSNKGAAA